MSDESKIRLFVIDVAAIALSAAEEAVRIPIAMIGSFYKGKRKFTITRQDIEAASANLAKSGVDAPLDYEHASEMPSVAAGGPVPAAGWIKAIDPKPDDQHVVWANVTFTDRARELIGNREYRYISPFLDWGVKDVNTGNSQGLTITSAALTNRPVLDRMPAIGLSAGWSMSATSTERGEEQQVATKEKVMCSAHPDTQLLCPQCDKDQLSASAAHQHQHQTPKVIALSDVARDAVGRLDMASIPGDSPVSGEVIRAFENQRIALTAVDVAISTGKIKPALKDHYTRIALSDVETFRAITKDLQQVDLSEHGLGGEGATGNLTELDKVSVALSTKTDEIVSRDKVAYPIAFKRAQAENPELVKRRHTLSNRTQRAEEE